MSIDGSFCTRIPVIDVGVSLTYCGAVPRLQTTHLVGAGLALPSFHTTIILQGQGKPSPYEMLKMFAEESKNLRYCNTEVTQSRSGAIRHLTHGKAPPLSSVPVYSPLISSIALRNSSFSSDTAGK